MKTYIWASPMRLFHWFLFLSVVCAYILGEEDELLNIHVAFGYIAVILLLFRIGYGFTGPRYSSFKDFPVKISTIRTYLSNIKNDKQNFAGHNPASAIIMLAILADVLLVGASGMLALAIKGFGPLKGFAQQGNSEIFKESHEIFVNLLIALVMIHLAGLIIDFYNNRKAGTIKSIFTGYKNVEGESIKESRTLNVFMAIVIVAAISVFTITARANYSGGEDREHYEEIEDED